MPKAMLNAAKIIMANKLFEYTKTERFAVVRKQPENRRYYANFKRLYDDKAEAETDAVRLAGEIGGRFYVIEILSITNQVKKVKKPVEMAVSA